MSLHRGRLTPLSLEVSTMEKQDFLDLANRLQLSCREALVHLLMLDNEQRAITLGQGQEGKKCVASSFSFKTC